MIIVHELLEKNTALLYMILKNFCHVLSLVNSCYCFLPKNCFSEPGETSFFGSSFSLKIVLLGEIVLSPPYMFMHFPIRLVLIVMQVES